MNVSPACDFPPLRVSLCRRAVRWARRRSDQQRFSSPAFSHNLTVNLKWDQLETESTTAIVYGLLIIC